MTTLSYQTNFPKTNIYAQKTQFCKPKIIYRFYIPDKDEFLKPFISISDRRLVRIENITDCTIRISKNHKLRRGQWTKLVIISGQTRTNVELCIKKIDESFQHFYALAPLDRSINDLKEPTIKDICRYSTIENLSEKNNSEVIYYKLEFFILSGCQNSYYQWRNGEVSKIIEKMNCHLVVAEKDHSDIGFLRRYAVILGPNKQDVMQAYKLFKTSFLNKYW